MPIPNSAPLDLTGQYHVPHNHLTVRPWRREEVLNRRGHPSQAWTLQAASAHILSRVHTVDTLSLQRWALEDNAQEAKTLCCHYDNLAFLSGLHLIGGEGWEESRGWGGVKEAATSLPPPQPNNPKLLLKNQAEGKKTKIWHLPKTDNKSLLGMSS